MTTEASDPQPMPPAAPAAAKQNALQRFAGALFAPAETFLDVARRPDIVMPLVIILILGYVTTALVLPRFDFETMIAKQESAMKKQNPNMTDSDLERMGRMVKAWTTVMGWIGPVLQLAWYALVAGVLLFAFRMFGGEGNYKQAFSTTMYAWTPLLLFGIILTIVALARGSVDPTEMATAVKSNLAFLVSMDEHPVLFSLVAAFDVFTLWTLALLTVGFATLSKTTMGRSASIVVSLWLLMLLVRVGFAALGAARMNA